MSAKYNVGERFEVEITKVDDTGMGTLYELNDCCFVGEYEIDKFSPLSAAEKKDGVPIKTHTPEDLKNRIFTLSKLLAEAIEKYETITYSTQASVEMIDGIINELKG